MRRMASTTDEQLERAGATRWVRRSELGTLVVSGADRVAWLNAVVTCDVREVGPGRAAWGLALTKQGKILTDLVVVEAGSVLLVSTAAAAAAEVAAHLEGLIVMEDAEVRDSSPEWAWWSIHGGDASAAAASVGGRAAWGAVGWTQLGDSALVAPATDASAVEAALRARCGGALGTEDWHDLRVEHQLPVFGRDFSSADSAHDASLEHRAVSWSKGCYLGQEVVCMQDMRGKARRRVVGLESSSAAANGLAVGARLLGPDGAEAGTVTSVARRSAGGVRAMGHVAAALAEPGTELRVGGEVVRVRSR